MLGLTSRRGRLVEPRPPPGGIGLADAQPMLPDGSPAHDGATPPAREVEPLGVRLLIEATRRSLTGGSRRPPGPIAPGPLVSIVVPLQNEQSTLGSLHASVAAVMDRHELPFEIIFVDDGSLDGSAAVLRTLATDDAHVRGLRLRRNFGKAAALATGFRAARAPWVVTIDADLQDDPEEIPGLLEQMCDGYDLVSGWKQRRRDTLRRRLASRTFNVITRAVSGVRLHDFNCGLKSYSQECAQELADSCYGEQHRYLAVIAHWKGFRVAERPVNHRHRAVGRSRYGIERYLRGLLDLITTVFLARYARRPMHVFGTAGLLLLIPGAAALTWLVFEKAVLGASIGGRPLLILGAVMLLAGLQLLLTGLVAEMVSRLPSLVSRLTRDAPSFPSAAIYPRNLPPRSARDEQPLVVEREPSAFGAALAHSRSRRDAQNLR
jgi:glycosyltransferase involved in cell wall biosynthesis